MGTFFETNEDARTKRQWVLIDAKDQTVGRLASKIAGILRGKTKRNFAPHTDTGDFVVVINAEQVKFTGSKTDGKIYKHHTGYIGSVKRITAAEMLTKAPERVLWTAVQGMLPKTPLGRKQLSKLKIYTGAEHPHRGQLAEGGKAAAAQSATN